METRNCNPGSPGQSRTNQSKRGANQLCEAGGNSLSPRELIDIIEFLPDATFVIDRKGTVIAWNRAIEDMTRVPKTDIVGKGGYSYSIPFYGVAKPIIIDYAMDGSFEIASCYECVTKEGDTCFAETFCPNLYEGKGAFLWAKASPLYDHEGNIIGAVESIRDLTSHRRAEEALRESEEKYRLIFQHTPLGIFHFDTDGTVTDCNDKIIEIWGSSRERFIGFNLLSSVKNKKMKAAVNTCLTGRYACYEGSYLSVTGGKISNLKADFGPVLSSRGQIVGGIAIIEDISERRSAQDALRESENRLRVLSSQLIATQEKERKRIANELGESIGALLTGIKYGLENALELAGKSELHPETLRPILGMVQQAMDESRRITTDLRPAMLDDLGIITTIRWFMRHFQSVYPDISARMTIAVEEEEIPDTLKIVIFRVIQEAFHNIAKHSRAKTVDVTLAKLEDRIQMEIKDDGQGFDPSAPSGKGGAGLGLLSMKERTEFSGGQITVDSREGSGALIKAAWRIETEDSSV
ncbi:MAG: PAS domain S-box protein [Syntrophobacter sp.]